MELITSLHKVQWQSDHACQQVYHLLRSNNVRFSEAIHYLSSPGQGYGRQTVYRDEYYELLVLTWSPYGKSAVHDHGDSVGLIQVVSGSCENQVFELENGKIQLLTQSIHRAGEVIVSPKNDIHQIVSTWGGNLISVHVYFPPLSSMHVYRLAESNPLLDSIPV